MKLWTVQELIGNLQFNSSFRSLLQKDAKVSYIGVIIDADAQRWKLKENLQK